MTIVEKFEVGLVADAGPGVGFVAGNMEAVAVSRFTLDVKMLGEGI